jgi:hypothetical protein
MVDSPILQGVERPFSLRYPSSLSSKQRRAIYEGQVRAFLESSEIVEMEEDVLDDILDGFGEFDEEVSDDVPGEQRFLPERRLVQDSARSMELLLPYGFHVFFGPQGIATLGFIVHGWMFICRVNFRVPTFPSRENGASLDETTDQGDDPPS